MEEIAPGIFDYTSEERLDEAKEHLMRAWGIYEDVHPGIETSEDAFTELLNTLWEMRPPGMLAPRRQTIDPVVRRLVMQRDEYACVLCGATERLQLDHIIPVAKAGMNVVDNLRVLCGPCNREKKDR